MIRQIQPWASDPGLSRKDSTDDYAPFPMHATLPFQILMSCHTHIGVAWPLLMSRHLSGAGPGSVVSWLCLTHSLRLPTFRLLLHVSLMLSVCSGSSFRQPGIFFPLVSNSQSFGAVVDHGFFEPGMLESLLSRDPLLWIVNEDLSQ